MRRLFFALAISMVLISPNASAAGGQRLVIAGTGDSQYQLRMLARLFERSNRGVKIEVPDSIGSKGGIRAVATGKADLGRTARRLEDDEKDGLVEFRFALSPIVFAVHPSVRGVSNLTPDQIMGIYSGVYTNWSQLGGAPHKLFPIDREAGDSSRTVLERYLPGFKDTVSVAKVFYTTPDASAAVAEHRFTIGFVPLGFAKHHKLRVLSVNGVAPGEASVRDGRYPYVTSFYLVSRKPPSSLAKRFIGFLHSAPAQRVMRNTGTIPVN